jgi:hypothetical protein
MGGSTGNIRTQRWQSGTVGSRTLGSILAGTGGGAGGTRRIYGYYAANGTNAIQMINNVFHIDYGQFQNQRNWFITK